MVGPPGPRGDARHRGLRGGPGLRARHRGHGRRLLRPVPDDAEPAGRGDRRRGRAGHRAVHHRFPGQVPAAGLPASVPGPGPGGGRAQRRAVLPRAPGRARVPVRGGVRPGGRHPAGGLGRSPPGLALARRRGPAPAGHRPPAGPRPPCLVHQPGGGPGRGRRAPALHRRAGRGPLGRAALRRGPHRGGAAPGPGPGRRHPVQEPAGGGPGLRLQPALRRRGHPGHTPDVSGRGEGSSAAPIPGPGAADGGAGEGLTADGADHLIGANRRALEGNLAKESEKLARQHKLFGRDRLALLLDADSFVEDGLLANATAPGDDLPADGVGTGVGRIDGRAVCVMANDPTVKAGSWGARTVEKIVRLTETALRHEAPVVYLVDSAGARITDQVELFPARRGAGRIFANEVRLSGRVPQVCCLFGPSAAGGAYIPAFCDVVFMVEGNASMYLGSPRMAEEVIGEHATLEEMGGARMHATTSGSGDNLVADDAAALDAAKRWLSYLPTSWREAPPVVDAVEPRAGSKGIGDIVPAEERRAYDMHRVVDALLDEGSFFELKPLFAKELIIGFGRMAGETVGIVANNPKHLGGVLFVDSADKAARFIWLCDAFNVPLVFLADVPGFMIGTAVEREGIIRHGAKMITAVTEASVPKFSVIVRKAYGAGLYAMCGPAFDPDACLALPTAQIAVMGPVPAVNAVFYNKIQAIEDAEERAAYIAERRAEYEADVDLVHLAAELVLHP